MPSRMNSTANVSAGVFTEWYSLDAAQLCFDRARECTSNVTSIFLPVAAEVLRGYTSLVPMAGADLGRLVEGRWTGMLAYVHNGTVDTWATLATVTRLRYDHFAFTAPFVDVTVSALRRRRRSSAVDWLSITAGLDVWFYVLIALSALALSLVLHAIGRVFRLRARHSFWHKLLDVLASLLPTSGLEPHFDLHRRHAATHVATGTLLL